MPDFLSAPSLSSILGFAAGVGYCALVRAPLIEHNFDSLTTINTRIPVLAISAWMGQANLNP